MQDQWVVDGQGWCPNQRQCGGAQKRYERAKIGAGTVWPGENDVWTVPRPSQGSQVVSVIATACRSGREGKSPLCERNRVGIA